VSADKEIQKKQIRGGNESGSAQVTEVTDWREMREGNWSEGEYRPPVISENVMPAEEGGKQLYTGGEIRTGDGECEA